MADRKQSKQKITLNFIQRHFFLFVLLCIQMYGLSTVYISTCINHKQYEKVAKYSCKNFSVAFLTIMLNNKVRHYKQAAHGHLTKYFGEKRNSGSLPCHWLFPAGWTLHLHPQLGQSFWPEHKNSINVK